MTRLLFLMLAGARGLGEVWQYGEVEGLAVVAAAVVAWRWTQVGHGLLAVAALTAALVNVPSHSFLLVALISAAFALFDGTDLTLVIRVQVVVVYWFAAVNKLWPDFASGSVLERTAPLVPWPAAMAWAVIAMEAGLALLVAMRSRWAFPLALLLHVGIVAAVSSEPSHTLSLLGFNGLMILLVWAAGPQVGTPHVRLRLGLSTT